MIYAAYVAPSSRMGDIQRWVSRSSISNKIQPCKTPLSPLPVRGTRNAINEPDPSLRPRLWNFPFWPAVDVECTDDPIDERRASLNDTDHAASQIHLGDEPRDVACRLHDLDLWSARSGERRMRHDDSPRTFVPSICRMSLRRHDGDVRY